MKIKKEILEGILNECIKGYPYEVCGVLIGEFKTKTVYDYKTIKNIFLDNSPKSSELLKALGFENRTPTGRFEFLMDPYEFNEVALKAQENGLDITGIFHSHPDHPALPSNIDINQPFIDSYSSLIVSVTNSGVNYASYIIDFENKKYRVEEILVI